MSAILHAAIEAADGGRLIDRALRDPAIQTTLDAGPLTVIAAGKAAARMAQQVIAAMPGRVARGLVTVLGPSPQIAPLRVMRTEHPAPGPGSEAAGQIALELVRDAPHDGCVLVLLSGGASSMLALPVAGVSLDAKAQTTVNLMHAGADITELNVVRKHLSRLKGGHLAAATDARTLALVISDVVGDDLSVVGSGPTVPDPSTFGDAIAVLDRYGVTDIVPPGVWETLSRGRRGRLPETPKPGSSVFNRTTSRLIGSADDAIEGAVREAVRLGYGVARLGHAVTGEARTVGAGFVLEIEPIVARLPQPACIVSAGETTVRVRGTGRGGRNQELVLAAAENLERLGVAAMASIGTDGVDGPTDAAGAYADVTTRRRARQMGLESAASYLDRNDTYEYFRALGDLIMTGPTGSNVGDLQVVLVDE